jgi:HSP20 family protein
MAHNQLTRGNGLGQHPLSLFRQQMDTLFDSFFRGWPSIADEEFGSQRFWDFDVRDQGKEMVVRAEMPGFDESDLNVELQNDVLTIRAEKRQEGEGREEFRSFFRSVSLPSGVDAQKVQATYHNGVLELHIPKPQESQAKRIAVQGSKAVTEQRRAGGNGSHGKEQPETAAPQKAKK